MTIATETITVLGQRLRFAFFGPEEASRILLVFNGIGASLETVASFAEHFDDIRILTFDAPGVGGSPAPLVPYRFVGLSRLIAKALDKLGVGTVDVFGVSWGGAAAQQFVHDYPQRCRTLVLAATSAGFVMVPGNISVLMKMATPKRYTNPNYMMEVGPQIYGGQMRSSAAVLETHAATMKGGNPRGYLYQLLAGLGWTSWLWLPRLELPVLVMMGYDDPIVPLINGRILTNRLPNSNLVEMPCGHLFMLTSPADTATKVSAFIHAHVD